MKSQRKAQSLWAVRRSAWLDGVKWKLADCLSLLACKLRRHPWYRGDCWASVPGNRAAELRQSVWERCVALEICAENKDPEWLDKIDRELTELGQIAGENWGHINDREREPSNEKLTA